MRQRKRQAVLCELGDGAVNMGAWHESLNLAALWNLPVVFLVVNNGYGMGTAVERASAEPELYKRASAFRMHGERVDGDDLDAVIEAADRLLRAAREQRRPAVLEAVTYRYRGHSVADAGPGLPLQGARSPSTGARPDRSRPRAAAGRRRGRGRARRDRTRAPRRASPRRWSHALASPEPPADSLACGRACAPAATQQFARMRPGSAFGEEQLVFDAGLGT